MIKFVNAGQSLWVAKVRCLTFDHLCFVQPQQLYFPKSNYQNFFVNGLNCICFPNTLIFCLATTERGGEMGTTEERILVSVRLRPLNDKEIARNDVSDWECLNDNTIIFKNANLPVPERSMYPTAYTFGMQFRFSSSSFSYAFEVFPCILKSGFFKFWQIMWLFRGFEPFFSLNISHFQ